MSQKSVQIKATRRLRRRRHIRRRLTGTAERPRLSIYRSLGHIYAQVIDDTSGRTLCSASSLEKEMRDSLSSTGNSDAAVAIGKRVAERAKEKGIASIVFDRNGFRYHGRVKALADAAREAGLEF